MSHLISLSLSLSFLSWKNGDTETPPPLRWVDKWIEISCCHLVTQSRRLINEHSSFMLHLAMAHPGITVAPYPEHMASHLGPFSILLSPTLVCTKTGFVEGAWRLSEHTIYRTTELAMQMQLQARLPQSPS